MAPNPKVMNAFKAMKVIGISDAKVKPVLKKLLKLYEKNWELIEAENYRVLADAIFDEEDQEKDSGQKRPQIDQEGNYEEEDQVEPLRPLKRLRRGQELRVAPSPSSSGPDFDGSSFKKPKEEPEELPLNSLPNQLQDNVNSPQVGTGNGRAEVRSRGMKGKEIVLAHADSTRDTGIPKRTSQALSIREPAAEPENHLSLIRVSSTRALIKPKDEPFTDDMDFDNRPQYDAPDAVFHPGSMDKGDSLSGNGLLDKEVSHGHPASLQLGGDSTGEDVHASSTVMRSNHELIAASQENPSCLEIASSPKGEVKILLSCNPAVERSKVRMPSLDDLRESVEAKCLRSYKIIDPSFSVMNLLKNVCECFLELTTNSSCESQEKLETGTPCDMTNKSTAQDVIDERGKGIEYPSSSILGAAIDSQCVPDTVPQVPRDFQDNLVGTSEETAVNGSIINNKRDLEVPDSHSLVLVPQPLLVSDQLRVDNRNDVTRGEEKVEVLWINEINKEPLPSFYYIPQNLVYQSAILNISLSRIGAEQCCSDCCGNCLAQTSDKACACARQTGKFVYTPDGLLDESFLAECVSVTRDPQQHSRLHCSDCPIKRSTSDGVLEPCKGHLHRNIIRECWSKCGCFKQCGNRVVQRGITTKLQVFYTTEGKGWGLRTLEKLPKGAFVCEFVGEILTIKELNGRDARKHSCPVLLDAFWVPEGVSKEEEAFCLDATNFGNVARFLNHRCFDANLIEIPVEIETPQHRYYHLAFFTTREIDVLEELTWDYGIDFDDNDHYVKPFQCRCSSDFCRSMKHSTRLGSPSSSNN